MQSSQLVHFYKKTAPNAFLGKNITVSRFGNWTGIINYCDYTPSVRAASQAVFASVLILAAE